MNIHVAISFYVFLKCLADLPLFRAGGPKRPPPQVFLVPLPNAAR